jgi:predicted flap endonuclease-1-like 5' DNA nuclease
VGQSSRPSSDADLPDADSSAELSVRLIAPGLTRDEPRVIDLRDQLQPHPAADLVPPASRQGEELIDIVGIGPKIADQLRQAGVVTLADLAGLDLDGPLPTSIEGLRGRLRQGDWVGQARRLTD